MDSAYQPDDLVSGNRIGFNPRFVLVSNIDSSRSVDLVNDRQFYVLLSRPRSEARIYTDNVQAMRRAVARAQEKELALEVVQQRPRQSVSVRI